MKMIIRQLNAGKGFNVLPLNLQQGLVLTKQNSVVAAYSKHANKVVFLNTAEDTSDIIQFLEELHLIDCLAANYKEEITDSFGIDYWDNEECDHLRV